MSFEPRIRSFVTADPGLPHPNPTTAYWQLPIHDTVGKIQSPVLPAETDILVIGSGVTKALLEDSSSFPGAHVTVLEARTLVSGATGRNGGHCVSAAGHKFSTWVADYGVEAAKDMARFSLKNMERVQELGSGMSAKVRERSEVRRVQKLCVSNDKALWKHCAESVAMFARELPEHKDHNRIVGKAELEEEWGLVDVVGGYAQPAGALWPYRLCTEIFAQLLETHSGRLAIETMTPATSVMDNGDDTSPGSHRYTVFTPRGPIKARCVVYCTNAYSGHLLPLLRGKIYPFRGHMSTQAVPERFPSWGASRTWSLLQPPQVDLDSGMYHHGLYYLQQNAITKDIFVGVENQRMDECLCSDDSFVSAASLQDLPTILPRMFRAVHEESKSAEKGFDMPRLKAIWSGVMGMTADGLPLVGNLPVSATGRTSPGGQEWIAAGFQGYGMDKCWLTGEALVAMMAGRDVSSWFPSAYLITEERLAKRLDINNVTDEYVQMEKNTRKDGDPSADRFAHI
ncbi:FAD dependent oxidoreductase superfamily [Grosmannia clavigera kw1407]|uniref:FAD dependent oxidoreductase superfamily n=1 Tax=Grosmannia clavigera (strain kw1407 / UAMH 11150) TaxID=655863 RepID=F0XU86_GROCL|nr:FAD dependent oxidoreductase superfamily [Grosmannia clavigera kw1407]EFW98590.1 FAD dependent oxidoreductase superfamily [Grosmannia clavigera kw1407]